MDIPGVWPQFPVSDISCCIRKRKKREFRGEKLQDRSVNEGTGIGKRNKRQLKIKCGCKNGKARKGSR